MVFDYRNAGLSEADLALCEYAIKLTMHPRRMVEQDVQLLREAGFSDEQITIAAQVIGYFNYINRIADGLGVDLEERMTMPIEEWLGKKAQFD